MVGIDELLNSVNQASENRIKQITDEAKKKAEELLCEAEKKAEENYKNIINKAFENAEDIKKRAESKAGLEEKNIILQKKRQLVKKVAEEAKQKLEGARPDEYFLFLKKLCEKAADEKGGEILLSEEDKKIVTEDFLQFLTAKNLRISKSSLKKGEKGFVISYGDACGGACGNIEENCTFDALYAAAWDRISDAAAEVLFGA